MAAGKLQKFYGIAPKISPELLPETVAQAASDVKTYSGDLVPYHTMTSVTTLSKSGTTMSIYPMDDGAGGKVWLNWTNDVDVAVAPIDNTLLDQRVYYTGDGEPRVTNYTLATSGANLPAAYYTLGLPLPLTAPTATATSPFSMASVSRTRDSGNIATITVASTALIISGSYVTVTGMSGTGYNLSNVQVTVVDGTHFSYYSNGTAEAVTADVGGTITQAGATTTRTYVYTWLTEWGEESGPSEPSSSIFLKEGQVVTIGGLPNAWPYGTGVYNTATMKMNIYRTLSSASGTSYFLVGSKTLGTGTTFTDNIDFNTLTTTLPSVIYDQPDPTMKGILTIHNSIMVGFFGNTLCFAEPGQPHAWPIEYQQQLDSNIVAIGSYGTSIIVATEKNPWLVQGSSPANVSKIRMDYILPCTSKRSLVSMGYGIAYGTTSGIAVYSSTTGGDTITKYVHSWETWDSALDSTTLIGTFYNGRYFGSHSAGSFTFEKDDQVGGFLVSITQKFNASYYDKKSARLYIANGNNLYLWDDPDAVTQSLNWKSKVIRTNNFINFGAARVVADYDDTGAAAAVIAANAAILAANQALIDARRTRGAMGGSMLGELVLDGSALDALNAISGAAQFNMYVNKSLIFSKQLSADTVFRLPAGYKADVFEFEVSGNIRVRAIHYGETPLSLKTV